MTTPEDNMTIPDDKKGDDSQNISREESLDPQRRDLLRFGAASMLVAIAAETASETASAQVPPGNNSPVSQKLAKLIQRIPGRITAPDEPEVRTTVVGQLVVIRQ